MSHGRAIVIVLISLVLAACASTPGGGGASVRSESIAINLLARHDDGAIARYAVGSDGVLHFAGGIDAESGRSSWSGPLTEDERTRLHTLITAHDWSDDPRRLRGTIKPPYDATIDVGRTRHHVQATKVHAELSAIDALLDAAARRRLDGYIQKLPKPSIETMQGG